MIKWTPNRSYVIFVRIALFIFSMVLFTEWTKSLILALMITIVLLIGQQVFVRIYLKGG